MNLGISAGLIWQIISKMASLSQYSIEVSAYTNNSIDFITLSAM
jgi:hypothetical protein